MAEYRENHSKNKTYLYTGKAGCFGMSNKKTEARIDEIERMEEATFEEALARWGIDASQASLIEPIVLSGPKYGPMRFGKKDGVLRAMSYRTFVLAFTETQLLLFEKTWNVINDMRTYITEEIFYKDINSVSVVEEQVELKSDNSEEDIKKKQKANKFWISDTVTANTLILRVSGSKFVSGFIREDQLTPSTILGMKNLIREKKNG